VVPAGIEHGSLRGNGLFVTDELGRTWKEAVVNYCKIKSRHLFEGIIKDTNILNLNIWSPFQELIPGSRLYEA
jgi:hypothetical protein